MLHYIKHTSWENCTDVPQDQTSVLGVSNRNKHFILVINQLDAQHFVLQ